MTTSSNFPTGTAVLGRYLDSRGEPLDDKGPLTHVTQIPVIAPERQSEQPTRTMIETGIKAVDLLAPLTRGGIMGIFGGIGVGKLVLVEELMYTTITRNNGYIVCLGMDEGNYEQSELTDVFQELHMQDNIVMLYEHMTDEQETFQRMVRAAFTIAAQFRQQGHPVLLVADQHTVTRGNLSTMPELKQFAAQFDVTTLLLGGWNEDAEQQVPSELLDAHIVLTKKLAQQRLYPALNAHLSSSHLLQGNLVNTEHGQVAQQVRQLLQRAQKLQSDVSSNEEKQIIERAACLQHFLTQPFFVAEPFTDRSGAYVPVAQTIRDCKAILDGKYDDVPVEAFDYVGSI